MRERVASARAGSASPTGPRDRTFAQMPTRGALPSRDNAARALMPARAGTALQPPRLGTRAVRGIGSTDRVSDRCGRFGARDLGPRPSASPLSLFPMSPMARGGRKWRRSWPVLDLLNGHRSACSVRLLRLSARATFDYHVITFPTRFTDEWIAGRLSTHGREGWEAVGVIPAGPVRERREPDSCGSS